MDNDRQVIRCSPCGMRQYKTRNGLCRRCLKPFPLPETNTPTFRFPTHDGTEEKNAATTGTASNASPKLTNAARVEKIGEQMRNLRRSRGLNQNQLQNASRVSRSYISRMEKGLMTPSLGTLEKIAEALSVPLRAFLEPLDWGLLDDPFVKEVAWHLYDIGPDDWAHVLQVMKGQLAIF